MRLRIPVTDILQTMPLISMRNIHLSFGVHPLLDDVGLVIERGERLCILGRNGSGKSTLMKILAGEIQPDHGIVQYSQNLRIARLDQEVPADAQSSITDIIMESLQKAASPPGNDASRGRQQTDDPPVLADTPEIWSLPSRIDSILSKLGLDGTLAFAGLSGGMKRRVMLAQALVQEPDLLLLDEPTNHLDVDTIKWLEEQLLQTRITLVIVSHDRALIRSLATRILELDRGHLVSWPGDYATWLERRAAACQAEDTANAAFDKRMAAEEIWIRKGIQARRTRNEGRVRKLLAMREAYAARRSRTGKADVKLQEAQSSGKLVISAEDLTFARKGQPIVAGFSTRILRGDKIGVIGPNGCGKSTLIQLLTGQISPDEGSVQLGTGLEIAVFDQLRDALDDNASVLDNLAQGRDTIFVNGSARHVMGYLQDFLFEPERARQPVRALSGGERSRLLLARLLARPLNFLILDEPTNDLDLETLELLEDRLSDFTGTLLIVSHDREFLDNLVTRTMVFEDTTINEYVGGYTDWQRQKKAPARQTGESPRSRNQSVAGTTSERSRERRLTYAERLELAALPEEIEALETRITEHQTAMSAPGFFQQTDAEISEASKELATLEKLLADQYERWSLLDQRAGDGSAGNTFGHN